MLLRKEIALTPNENVIKEVTISTRYRYLLLIINLIIFLTPVFILDNNTVFEIIKATGILVSLFSIFYYLYYLPVSNYYVITNERLIVQRGWLSLLTDSIEYEKITDIKSTQGIIERFILGTGSIYINTAGGDDFEISLKNVDEPEDLRVILNEARDNRL